MPCRAERRQTVMSPKHEKLDLKKQKPTLQNQNTLAKVPA